jgi:hypothetical protein
MFHEEKIINGRLCWRSTPEGKWQEYSVEQVTAKLEEVKQELQELSEYLRKD